MFNSNKNVEKSSLPNDWLVGYTNRHAIAGFRDFVADKTGISDDSGWSQRQVLFHLIRYRAALIQQKEEAGKKLSRFNYQTIPCIPLIETDVNECPCAPASGCKFLKTKWILPKPVSHFKSITSIDGGITYSFVEWDKFKYKINSRFESQSTKPYYTTKNTGSGVYIYVYNDQHKEFITPTSIFENPIDVQRYPDCEGKVEICIKPLDLEWIMDPDLLMAVYDLSFRNLFRIKSMVSDLMNNDNDDNIRNQQPPK